MEVIDHPNDCITLLNNEMDYSTMLYLYSQYALKKDDVLLSKIEALLPGIIMKDILVEFHGTLEKNYLNIYPAVMDEETLFKKTIYKINNWGGEEAGFPNNSGKFVEELFMIPINLQKFQEKLDEHYNTSFRWIVYNKKNSKCFRLKKQTNI